MSESDSNEMAFLQVCHLQRVNHVDQRAQKFVEYFGANNLPCLFVRDQIIIYFALDHRQSHGANKVGPRTEKFVCVCRQILLNILVQIICLVYLCAIK